MLVNMNKK